MLPRTPWGYAAHPKYFTKEILQIFEILKAVEFIGIVLYWKEKCQKRRTRVLRRLTIGKYCRFKE